MDLRYENYVNPKYKFYTPNDINKNKTKLKLNYPEGWRDFIDSEKHWRYAMSKNMPIPPQGWKIHISSTIDQSQETLNIVSKLLFDKNINFKFVMSKWDLFVKNSKYGDRSSSGKFITIYPTTEYVFFNLLDELSDALKKMKPGAYILNDDRWLSSNVYFRYGGFIEMKTADGKMAIIDENNNFIPDRREPQFVLPDFVTLPKKIQEMEKEKEKASISADELKRFDITEVIHFSNGGGVYKGVEKKSHRNVILKEGRPEVGLDSNGNDGYHRIDVEYTNLSKLKDVEQVVDVFESFKAWEHNYLVEDIAEGVSLNSWTAQNYPFICDEKSITDYKEKALHISKELINAVNLIHEKHVGMGDLSPTNVLVNNKDLKVTLIDFESAGDSDEEFKQGLQTPGFASGLINTRKEADNFALYRMLIFTFLPIAPIQDIDKENENIMLDWIERIFGSEVVNLIARFRDKSNIPKDALPKKFITYKSLQDKSYNTDIEDTIKEIREGILNNLSKRGNVLIPGDIRQFETVGGKDNILTGGFGVVMALIRTSSISEEKIVAAESWVKRFIKSKRIKSLNDGLFTGKAGIACILFDLGYEDIAIDIIKNINFYNLTDVSLISGLAGIGLSILSLYSLTSDEELLSKATDIGNKIKELFNKNHEIVSIDPDFITTGLLDGWTGSSMFLNSLYRITGDKQFLDLSKSCFEKDLQKCSKDKLGVLHVDDEGFRLLPYLAGGTVGMALVADQLLYLTGDKKFENTFKEISPMSNTQCCYNIGLFRGYSSFVLMDTILGINYLEHSNISKNKVQTLSMYLIKEKNWLMCPGDYGYKLSGDLFSGSAGVLLSLYGNVTNNPYNWIPICGKSVDKIF